MADIDKYRKQIQEMLLGYRITQALIACTSIGVFDYLGNRAADVEEMAQALKVDASAFGRLLNAAVALELLEKDGALFRASPLAAACLVPNAPAYMGRQVQREEVFFRRWTHLTEAVRTGKRPEENIRDEEAPGWVRKFELSLYDSSRVTGPLVAKALEPFLTYQEGKPLKLVDIGGGHGGYAIAMAELYPELTGVVFDLPAPAEVAREIVASSAVADRVNVAEGDFKVDELGDGYDIAFLFGILHSETPETCLALLDKVFNAMTPGGLVVIRGFYLNQDRTGTPETTLVDLHLLLSTDKGAGYSVDDLAGWLIETGFQNPETIELPANTRASLLVARK